jgi:HEAT repeat protein
MRTLVWPVSLLFTASLLAAPDPLARSFTVSVDDCRKELRSPKAEERRVAAIELGRLGSKAEPALPELVQAMHDPDLLVAHEACNTLVRIGPNATPLVAKKLRDESPWVRWQAMDVLLRLGPDAKAAVPALADRVAKAPKETLRILCAMKLGRLGSDARAALPVLIQTAGDRGNLGTSWHAAHPSSVCEAAIEAVKRIDPTALDKLSESALPTLIDMLRSDDAGERQAAMGALALLGKAAAPALPALRDALLTNRSHSRTLVTTLASLGAKGQRTVLEIVNDNTVDLQLRRDVLANLAFRPGLESSTVRQVAKLLTHPDRPIRSLAAMTLASQGAEATPYVRALVEGLADPALLRLDDGSGHWQRGQTHLAAEALSRIGAKAVPPLIEALQSEGKRAEAMIALGRMGPAARDAREPLGKLLQDDNPLIALQAAGALLRLGDERQKPLRLVIAGLRDQDGRVSRLAFDIVYHSGTPGLEERMAWRVPWLHDLPRERGMALPAEAFPPLLALLGDEQLGSWAAIVLARQKEDAPRLVPRLTKLLRDKDSRVRANAVQVLHDFGAASAAATSELARLLEEDPSAEVQAAALRALASIGPEASAATPVLLRILAQKRNREEVLDALGSIRPTSREAVTAVASLLNPSSSDTPKADGYRRSVAMATLGKIGPAARTALPALRAGLLDEDAIVRVEATYALAAITDDFETYLPLLLLAGRDAYDPEERYPVMPFVLEALKRLGPKAAKATPWLVERVSGTGDVRADREHIPAAIQALGAIGPAAKAALPRLRKLAVQGKAPNAALAAEAIRQIEGR